jgi:hypothetical protein
LALRAERVKKKEQYEIFVRNMKDFIRVKFETGKDLDPAFDKLACPLDRFNEKHKPQQPADDTDTILVEAMKEEIKLFAKRKITLRNNIDRAYTYVWGQCTPSLQACVRHEEFYEAKSEEGDFVWLLAVLRKLTAGVDEQANEYLTLYNGISKIFFMRQFKGETNDSYLDRFNTNLQALDLSNGSFIFECPGLILTNTGVTMDKVTDADKRAETERFKAILLLMRSDEARYGDLIQT